MSSPTRGAAPLREAEEAQRRTVLVTGASGFLGASLVARLLSDGRRVRILVRSPIKAARLAARGVEVTVGDIADPSAVSAAVADVAIVYHLAGRLLVPGIPPEEYHKTHVEGTKVVVACCERERSLLRFVHCSTTGVLGTSGDRPVDENAPIRPTNVYEATKAEAEEAIREAQRDGFPAVIARPGLVYGPGDLHLLPFFRSVLSGRFRPIGRRTVWLHPIYIDDVTDGLVRCADHRDAIGECFHLAGQAPASLTELAVAIARAGGTGAPTGHIPLSVAQALAALADQLPPALRRSAPLTRSRVEFLTHSRVYDVTKAQRLLGFAAATDLQTGTDRTMAWYCEHGYLAVPASSRVAASA